MYNKENDREDYERWHRYGRERGWFQKVSDEVRSWFGDEEADRRRRMDDIQHQQHESGQRIGPRMSHFDDNEHRSLRGEYGNRFYGRESRQPGMYGSESGHGSGIRGRQFFDEDSRREERFGGFGSSGGYGGSPNAGTYGQTGSMYGSSYGTGYGGGNDWETGRNYGYGSSGMYGNQMSERNFPHHSESFAGRGSRSYQRNDERIRDDVHERLARHHEIDATEIDVDVQNGEVTLKGMVNSRWEKRMAEDVTEGIFGVRNVHNMLRVNQGFGLGTPAEMPATGRTGNSNPPTGTTGTRR